MSRSLLSKKPSIRTSKIKLNLKTPAADNSRKASRACLVWMIAAALTVSLAGCGDGLPKRVPISGSVLVDGKPLTYGSVLFVPEGMRPSAAEVDEQGRFTLRCFDGEDGAVVGTHRVQVSASDLRGPRPVWHAPRKYADFRTSGLTHEVNGADDAVVIELTWDGEERPR